MGVGEVVGGAVEDQDSERAVTDERPTHLDLFSGIGGFAIAAQEAGFRTVGFCESDSRCRAFLEKRWGLPVEPDIRQLDGRRYTGVSLLTGGPPCQPASRAGKQGGAEDDRWLWPEALRVLDEAKPDCVVFENPPGILDVGLDGILSEMGRLGCEVQVFDIPACAVDSPQLRHRLWIVGFASGERSECKRESRIVAGQSGEIEGEAQQRERRGDAVRDSGEDGRMADTTEPGREGRDAERDPDGPSSERAESVVADTERERWKRRSTESRQTEGGQSFGAATGLHWQNAIWVPCADGKLRRAPDDSFLLVDGLHRSLLGALGNSIVPQVAVEILKAVRPLIK